jgi:hypothetical protein
MLVFRATIVQTRTTYWVNVNSANIPACPTTCADVNTRECSLGPLRGQCQAPCVKEFRCRKTCRDC